MLLRPLLVGLSLLFAALGFYADLMLSRSRLHLRSFRHRFLLLRRLLRVRQLDDLRVECWGWGWVRGVLVVGVTERG